MEKALIGSQEWCSFENLNIPSIKARIDSGAKTSSIQSTKIKIQKAIIDETEPHRKF